MTKLEKLTKDLAVANIKKISAMQEYRTILNKVKAEIKGQLEEKARAPVG